MIRDELVALHFITPVANLPSITRHGIVCNRRAKNMGAVSIALEGIQAIRADKRVPGGLMLHDYACLYFNARNPMLFLRRGQHAALCVVSIRTAVLDLPEVVITDQNAASKWARFAAAPDGVSIVSREKTFAERWTHPDDQIEEWRHKAAMCAEVLVPDAVPPSLVQGAYVSGEVARQRIDALGIRIATAVDTHLFFQ
jgi:ssDNA thymidine ADP-ribosyltransferase DarT-like protein